jgi:hypothetical protein
MCADGLGRAKLLLLSANGHRAERAARANVRIHGKMAEHRSCCPRSISPASGIAIPDRIQDAEAKAVYLQRKRPSANSDALVLWRLAAAAPH